MSENLEIPDFSALANTESIKNNTKIIVSLEDGLKALSLAYGII